MEHILHILIGILILVFINLDKINNWLIKKTNEKIKNFHNTESVYKSRRVKYKWKYGRSIEVNRKVKR